MRRATRRLSGTLLALFVGGVPTASAGDAPAASDKLKPFGDFRLRHESDLPPGELPDRHRQRIRLRAGASYDITEDFTVVGALRTGNPESPKSPHQTLGNEFDSYTVSFDQAYVRWHPNSAPGFFATAGKFPQPFITNPVYADMQWDSDIRPEGFVAGYVWKPGKSTKATLTGARYTFLERGGGKDVSVWAGQAAISLSSSDGVDWTLAVDFHDVGDTEPGGTIAVVGDNAGNLLVDTNGDGIPDSYASDFSQIHPLLVLKLSRLGLGRPLTLAAELVRNSGAVNQDDTAFSAAASLGAAKKKGDWQVYWQYLQVQQESLFSVLSQDDFTRSTNLRGHLFGVRYLFHDKINLNCWGLPSRADTPADSEYGWRWRADLNLSL